MSTVVLILQTYLWRPLMDREEGQTLAEYAMVLAVIALVVLVATTSVGKSVSSIFSSVSHAI